MATSIEALKATYARDGFIWLSELVSPAELPILRDAAYNAFGGNTPGSLPDIWQQHDAFRKLMKHPVVMDLSQRLYNAECLPYSGLTYVQSPRRPVRCDWQEFESYGPPGHTFAVWVFLDDMTRVNGPLVLYPGTHQWDPIPRSMAGAGCGDEFDPVYDAYIRDKIQDRVPTYLFGNAGDAVVIHGHLLYGAARPHIGSTTLACHRTLYGVTNAASFWCPKQSTPDFSRVQFVQFPQI